MDMKKLEITSNKGFHITFENGLTASVQWGRGNYCQNHFNKNLDFSGLIPAASDNAEVAVIGISGDLIEINRFLPEDCSSDGIVAGWLTPENIVDFLMNVKNAKDGEPLRCEEV